jgi:hypothetical protein
VALAWLITAAAIALGWFAPGLPVDDLATRLAPGRKVEAMCAGLDQERLCLPTILPELRDGRHFVVLIDVTAEGMDAEVESLNRYAQGNESPRLVVLSSGTAEQNRAFFWKYGPAFEVREAPASILKPLYRTLPRSFLVWDGDVTETWSGLPDAMLGAVSSAPPRNATDRKAVGESG